MSRIKKNLTWSLTITYSLLTINAVSVIFVSRILTLEEIGIISVSMVIVGIAGVVRGHWCVDPRYCVPTLGSSGPDPEPQGDSEGFVLRSAGNGK